MTANLARKITWKSSKQSYYITRLLVDNDLHEDCFRAYAYFRWVDDCVDDPQNTPEGRVRFIEGQKLLVNRCYDGKEIKDLLPQEKIIRDLIANDRGEHTGLKSFINNFMAIIDFDAHRKDSLISQDALDWYSHTLSVAVTDAIQYFIRNGRPYPDSEFRYLAANAAHITHMLRDMQSDLENGYTNIPLEYLTKQGITAFDVTDKTFCTWVRYRVKLARSYLRCGKHYLNGLDVLRCKIAGYWYCARFEPVLDRIERDQFLLRSDYSEGRKFSSYIKMIWLAFTITIKHNFKKYVIDRITNMRDKHHLEYANS